MVNNTLFIGIMTGTSIDAVDAVIAEIGHSSIKQLGSHRHAFPNQLKQDIERLLYPSHDELSLMLEVDNALGHLYVKTVHQLLEKYQIPTQAIKAIGLHGQTIRHYPDKGITLQIGNPNIVSEITGITTINDFRRKDLAKGGQGAPLAPLFHEQVFRSQTQTRAVINLGGICNITVLPPYGALQQTMGYDIGPANVLLDAWTQMNIFQALDQNGRWASQGQVNQVLLQQLLADPYFAKKAPKSTGREYFNLSWLTEFLNRLSISTQPVDVQRTLVELTAVLITQALDYYSIEETYLCGGGAYNQFLVERLKALNTNRSISSTKSLGIEPDWVEALLCAWLAKMTFYKEGIDTSPVTGAKAGKSILGGIYA